MNSKLPSLKSREVVSTLFRIGFAAKHTRGSHLTLVKEEKRVTAPLHSKSDLTPGTLSSILKQAGLTRKDFIGLLRC